MNKCAIGQKICLDTAKRFASLSVMKSNRMVLVPAVGLRCLWQLRKTQIQPVESGTFGIVEPLCQREQGIDAAKGLNRKEQLNREREME
jgi:hypothetical protein